MESLTMIKKFLLCCVPPPVPHQNTAQVPSANLLQSPNMPLPIQPTGDQIVSSKFTWKITNFTTLTGSKYYSGSFTIGGNSWRILAFPKGNNTDYLSVYLDVADSATLSAGWTRTATFSLTLVDQRNSNNSIKKQTSHEFTAREVDWGFTSMVPLTEVHDRTKGFLVDDTLIIEAQFDILPAEREEQQAVTSTEMFDTYFSDLEQLISAACSTESSLPIYHRTSPSNSQSPSLEEVENAKRSLKECLSDLFKLNMKDRLAEALSTLSMAEDGLSPGQRSSVQAFWAGFGVFTSDFLTFEQDNSEFELQKLLKDQMFSEMKKGHERHLSFKKLSEELIQEEEECKRKLEEVRTRKDKVVSDWEVLLAESQATKSKYVVQEKQVKDAEEKKRVAEERMSRSTAAWSNLKAQFM